MAMFPEAQAKAQAEIDAVIGNDRLPDFSDYDFLPYIIATAKECMRWQLVLPLGRSYLVARVCSAADVPDSRRPRLLC